MSEHNPKYIEALKRGKLDFSVVPWAAIIGMAQAMNEGAGKYGRFNFRQDKIEARTYIAAIMRHLLGDPSTGSVGWINGEDIDEESGLHHLHKVMACCALVIDAQDHGMLIDNRLTTESLTPPSEREAQGETQFYPCMDDNFFDETGMIWGRASEGWNTNAPVEDDGFATIYQSCPHCAPQPSARDYHAAHAEPGWYVEFRDATTGDVDEVWVHIAGPFDNSERAEFYAQVNPDNYAGTRSIFEIESN